MHRLYEVQMLFYARAGLLNQSSRMLSQATLAQGSMSVPAERGASGRHILDKPSIDGTILDHQRLVNT